MYRLTLVKAWNTEEIDAYVDLVSRGNPDFIEVKVSGRDHNMWSVVTQVVLYFTVTLSFEGCHLLWRLKGLYNYHGECSLAR